MRQAANGTRHAANSERPANKEHRPRISIIVAYAANNVIGKAGKMPWHLPEDLKRFRQLTMGHHIIMGRKTWESLGRLLPGRQHVIVSRRPHYAVPGARVVDSIETAICACAGDTEIFIIGGGEIYALALPIAQRIYATEIACTFDGDVHFPALDPKQWYETATQPLASTDALGRYVVYERQS